MGDKKNELNKEEEALLRSIEAGEWRSVENLDVEKRRARMLAQKTRIFLCSVGITA